MERFGRRRGAIIIISVALLTFVFMGLVATRMLASPEYPQHVPFPDTPLEGYYVVEPMHDVDPASYAHIDEIDNRIRWKLRWGLDDWDYLLMCAWDSESHPLVRQTAIGMLTWKDPSGYGLPPEYIPEAKDALLDALSGDWVDEDQAFVYPISIVTLGRLGLRKDPEVEALLRRILDEGPREMKILARRVLDGVDDPE
ncbi:MAG: hypothetical protein AAGG07_08095 [Planctomycetota bacterium]